MVGTETTGHAESVEITFDPKQISYGQLLRLFFSVAHDPTELNRQGPDSGPSYRSEIFFAIAVAGAHCARVCAATDAGERLRVADRHEDRAAEGFYAAEDYHQDYLIHNPHQPYIVYNDLPKIDALKRVYPQLYRPTPVALTAR